MSEAKMKVKDLAAELAVGTKDLLHALRELDIPAKSTMSSIDAEDVSRVRRRFAPGETESVTRREVGDGVIVRRRRREVSSAAKASPSASEHAVRDPDEAVRGKADERPREADALSPAGDGVRDASAQDAAEEKKSPRLPKRTGTRPESRVTSDARIIRLPSSGPAESRTAHEGAAPSPGQADAAPVPEKEEDAEAAAEANAAPRALRATPDASALPEGSSAPTLPQRVPSEPRARQGDLLVSDEEGGEENRRGRRRKRPEAAVPQVRVISRPAAGAPARAVNRDGRVPRPGLPAASASRPGGGRPPASAGLPGAPVSTDEGRDAQSKKKRLKGRRTVDFQQGDTGRRRDLDDDAPRLSRGRRRKSGKEVRPPAATQPMKAGKRKIRVTEAIRVSDMAHQMGIKSNEIIKVLFGLGVMATINQALDLDTAALVAAEFEYEVEKAGFSEEDALLPARSDSEEQLKARPPVVTIMGHVDHGKTSLLDAIRKSSVAAGEAGGITQHIGAYHVKTKRGDIVFLDTPGHEAFTAMRARGAQVTDIVVLVVAADDGVMEQTREAVNHARAADVPIMVAVNKIDKPGANPDHVLRELAELGLQSESWGGRTVTALVSAKTRQGLDELLELIALQAEILELRANPDKPARGHIVEAKLDKGRGPVATVLIQEGTLKPGDNFVCGVFSGRVRALFNDQGRKVKEAGPAIPVEVQGFDGVPEAGEKFVCLGDEKLARRIADTRAVKQRERELAKESKVTLETFLSRRPGDQESLVLNLLVKADVQGSLEAITEALHKQSTDKVRIHIIHGGAGTISESDILLASASQAITIGFNVRPTAKIKETAERENVDIRFYDVIYKLVEDVKSAMEGLLAPVQREVYLGQTQVRKTFSVPRAGVIAGCLVSDGKITRNAGARLLRDGVVVYTGRISSLKRFKDDVREVLKGYECGVGLENFNDIKADDIIEAFETVEEADTL
jgi:translation initiation factor IF-2